MTHANIFRLKTLKVFIFFSLCALSTYFILNFFQIKTIEVVGDNILLSVDTKTFPKNLLFFQTDKVTSEILSQNPLIESVSIAKKYPYTLVLSVTKRIPIARIKSLDRFVALSFDGVVVDTDRDFGQLPELNFPLESVLPGNKISDKQILFALTLLAKSPPEIHFNRISTFDTHSVLAESEKTDIFFSLNKPIDESMSTLQNLLAGFRIKGIIPSQIDLRFEKIIIK